MISIPHCDINERCRQPGFSFGSTGPAPVTSQEVRAMRKRLGGKGTDACLKVTCQPEEGAIRGA